VLLNRFARSIRRLGVVPAVLAAVLVLGVGAGVAATVAAVVGGAGAPANDELVTASLVRDLRVAGDLTGSTASAEEVAAGIGAAGDGIVWFAWTPDDHGWANLTPTAASDTGPFPAVQVFTGGRIDDLTRVDLPGADGLGTSVPAVAGESYSIAIAGAAPLASFDFTLFQPDAGERPNDEPGTAIDIGAAVTQAVAGGATVELGADTLGGATAAPGEPGVGGQDAEHSVWYGWVVPFGGGSVTLAVEPDAGGSGPFRVGVWRGTSIADLELVGGGTASATITGAEGDRFLISVDGPEQFHRLTLSAAGVASEDVTPPVVSCADAPASWTAGPVTVACTAVDGGSGLADAASASFDLVAELEEGGESSDVATDVRVVCDRAGNCADAGPVTGVRIDLRPPEASCDAAPADWSATNPVVTCVAADDGSGLADPADATREVATSVAEGEARPDTIPARPVCDAAGNCRSLAEIGPVLVDRAAPVIVCDPAPTGVQRAEVSIACIAGDDGAGLADPGASGGFTLVTDVGTGAADLDAATTERQVCDTVGNCATAGPFTVAVDRAAPAVRCDVPDGWSRGSVAVACEASDDGVGLDADAAATFTLTATLADGEESATVSTDSRRVCDLGGACAEAGPFVVRIDNRAPAVACTEPTDQWTRDAEVLVDCGVRDGGSGLPSPDDELVRLTATGPDGEATIATTDAVDVCDRAGNCATAGPVAGIRIDRIAPEVTCSPPPGGTLVAEGVARCTSTEAGSGLRELDDSSFELSTSVGVGNADPAARTGEHEVCDVAGNCTAVGPFTADVDLRDNGLDGPAVDTPSRVTVLAAVEGRPSVPLSYEPPAVAPGASIACQPGPATRAGDGWVLVTCDARGADGGRRRVAFPLVVKPLPALAPSGSTMAGGAWRAVGVGFAPGSAVQVEIDGSEIATAVAGADGRVRLDVVVPSPLNPGSHDQVVRGVDPNGDPLLVVSPVTIVADPDAEPPTAPPVGAPELPATGPAIPPDPPGEPVVATFEREVPEPTTTTTSPSPPSTGGPSTTAPDGPDPSDPSEPPGPTDPGGDDGDAADPGAGSTTGTLPVTGLAVGTLVLVGLALLIGGLALRRASGARGRER
jgi:hypothetical protein